MAIPEKDQRWTVVLWTLVAAATVLVPLIVFPGESSFRVVKSSVFMGIAIVIAGAAAVVAVWRGTKPQAAWFRSSAYVVAAAAVGWTAVVTATSTNRAISIASFVWVASGAIYFVATVVSARNRTLLAVAWPALAAIINAIILVLQITEVWNPFVFPEFVDERIAVTGTKKLHHTALIGNPNDVGAYFVAPALALSALALVTSGRNRFAASALALLCAGAVVASEAMTAIIALLGGIIVLVGMVSRRQAVVIAVSACILLATSFATYPPLRQRLGEISRSAAAGDFNRMLSHRLVTFRAAFEIWRTRPILGVGPGCFAVHYFDVKTKLDRQYTRRIALGESVTRHVHNDHLQVLAQAGLPGYALFVAAVVILGQISLKSRTSAGGSRSRFAAALALPLAVAFAVEATAGFPLELAATTCVFLYFAGLCFAWADTTG